MSLNSVVHVVEEIKTLDCLFQISTQSQFTRWFKDPDDITLLTWFFKYRSFQREQWTLEANTDVSVWKVRKTNNLSDDFFLKINQSWNNYSTNWSVDQQKKKKSATTFVNWLIIAVLYRVTSRQFALWWTNDNYTGLVHTCRIFCKTIIFCHVLASVH